MTSLKLQIHKYTAKQFKRPRISVANALHKDLRTHHAKTSPDAALTARNLPQALMATLTAVSLFVAPAVNAAADPIEGAKTTDQTQELFDPVKYVGRWYEVGSLKTGFAGEGQQDCHCTQGDYVPIGRNDKGDVQLEVSTFCFHGSPQGKVSGIQGSVRCLDPATQDLVPESKIEQEEQVVERCQLRFPAIPFIPNEPYDVIRTDYDDFALVRGSKDKGFVQIYSRRMNPGDEWIQDKKNMLGELGYDVSKIRDTPQDCPELPMKKLQDRLDQAMAKMNMDDMKKAMEVDGVTPQDLPIPMGTMDMGALTEVKAVDPGRLAINELVNPLQALKDLTKLFSQ